METKMSFADYIHGMSIKYRLAVAIAVLKGKPNDLSLEQYIKKLKAKYENSAMETDGANISICSDDFLLNDDDLEAINDGFNDTYNDVDEKMVEVDRCARKDSLTEVLQSLKDIDNFKEKENNAYLPMALSQNLYIDDSQLFEYPTKNSNRNTNENTHLRTTELLEGHSSENTYKNDDSDMVSEITKNNDEKFNVHTKTTNNINHISDLKDTNMYNHSKTAQNVKTISDNTRIDSQATEIYSYSQNTDIDEMSYYNQQFVSQMTDIANAETSRSIYDRNKQIHDSEKFFNDKSQGYDTKMANIHSKRDYNDGIAKINEPHDSQQTEMYAFSQNFTHVSQSQFEIIDIPRKYICGKKNDKTIISDDGIAEDDTIFHEENVGNKSNENEKYISEANVAITAENNLNNNMEINEVIQEINMDEKYIETMKRNDSLLGMHRQFSDTMTVAPHSLNNRQIQLENAGNLNTNREENNDRNTGILSTQNFYSDTMLIPQGKQNTQIQQNYTELDAEYDRRNTDTMLMVPQHAQNIEIQEDNANNLNTMELIKRVNETLETHSVNSSQIQYIIDKDGKMYKIIHIPSQSQQYNIINNKGIVKTNDSQIQHNKAQNEEVSKQNIEKLDKTPVITYKNNKTVIQDTEMHSKYDQRTETKIANGQKTLTNNTSAQNTNILTIPDHHTVPKTNNEHETHIGNMDTDSKYAKLIEQNTVANIENLSQNVEHQLDIEDFTDSQIEVIPFKVIEEMNRIKNYLNRGERKNIDGSQTDSSGYKSDSQISIRNASQTQNTWLNQSAYCLYNYLLDCQLISTTQEITAEVSQVLANLVDRLHEEEHYPPFLSAILETIDKILHDILQGNSYGEDVLVQKDENIQRICLLNKSVHILKYTIEKVTEKLESVHKNLTDNEKMYELSDIEICENVCYIFHVLEIFLKRYLKVRGVLSQSTQNSQDEEKLLKKSSIVDIWRKKWIPNYKEKVSTDVCMEKQCVLTKCGEVLNKIIVGCMEGYSLVSFAALQCFNLLQIQ